MKNLKVGKKATKNLRFAVLASDIVILALREGELCLRLTRVNRPPYFINRAGLPGGLLLPYETAEETALRLIKEKAGIKQNHIYMEQLYTFSEVKRDPRGRVVAVAYLALIPWNDLSTSERMDSENSWWCPIKKLPHLAYDHDKISAFAIERLRGRITYTTLINKLLPKEFTLMDLENAYNVILGKKVDRRNFRKKIIKLKLLSSLKRKVYGLRWRPAALYAFRRHKVLPIDIL